jgi:hypothetical protein
MFQKPKTSRTIRRKRVFIITLSAVIALIIIGLLLSAWQNWLWFSDYKETISVTSPGAAVPDAEHMVVEQAVANQVEERLLSLLMQQGQLAAWYRMAGKTGDSPEARSSFCMAQDQIIYGQFLAEQNRKKEFEDWWKTFRSFWITDQGFYARSADLENMNQDKSTLDLRVHLSLARLLAYSCTISPDDMRSRDLQAVSDVLINRMEKGFQTDTIAVVPTGGAVLDPAASPTPKPTATPTPAPAQGQKRAVLRLGSIDLFALQVLTQIDSRWQTQYAVYREIAENGYLTDTLPLYAWAWDPDAMGYVPFEGDQPAIDTQEAMLTVLHLTEAGLIPDRSITWIRDQLYNNSALYRSYHPAQGIPIDERECLPAYAMTARIARMIHDEHLYQAAVNRLLWHQATNQRSDIRWALFRTETEQEIRVWSLDNVWALLAMR